jgi:hypothetical protein
MEFHASAALPPGKQAPVPIGEEAGWTPLLSFKLTTHTHPFVPQIFLNLFISLKTGKFCSLAMQQYCFYRGIVERTWNINKQF